MGNISRNRHTPLWSALASEDLRLHQSALRASALGEWGPCVAELRHEYTTSSKSPQVGQLWSGAASAALLPHAMQCRAASPIVAGMDDTGIFFGAACSLVVSMYVPIRNRQAGSALPAK